MSFKFYFALILATTLLGSCGGSNTGAPSAVSSGNIGVAKLIVSNSRGTQNERSYSHIKKFVVRVTASDINEPIEMEFDGALQNGLVSGIPAGDKRLITVIAVNDRDQPIREGGSEPITIVGGAEHEVSVVMDSIPIFANVTEGNHISSSRLNFMLFADPEDPLELGLVDGDSESPLYDLVTNDSLVYPDVSTGLARLHPKNINIGEQTFIVRSKRTGKSSSLNIVVEDGSKIKAAPLFAGGSSEAKGEHIAVRRAGGIGASWPEIIENILQQN